MVWKWEVVESTLICSCTVFVRLCVCVCAIVQAFYGFDAGLIVLWLECAQGVPFRVFCGEEVVVFGFVCVPNATNPLQLISRPCNIKVSSRVASSYTRLRDAGQ